MADATILTRDFDRDTLVPLRREVERCGERHRLTGAPLYRFVVAVNEITTNAVRHGGGRGRLKLWLGEGRLYCRVTDRGPGLLAQHAEPAPPPSTSTSGRGLLLARHGVSRLTICGGPDGTSILLEVLLPSPA
ncbi:ATP-binding protein [Nonomuraea sp. LPB2021202275-12-8]|uniref:ATP-binding protein n=1 Tax=Nonomuraea sp. LPB2021202275-12-8 TaxID=3120159 RepID=UPI00300C3138